MTIGIPDMAAYTDEDLERMVLDAMFQLNICDAFLERARAEVKRRADAIKKQRREGLQPVPPALNTKVH